MRRVCVSAIALLAAACSGKPSHQQVPSQASAPPPGPQPANAGAIAQVNGQPFAPPPQDGSGPPSPVLIKAEVLLDRAHFSPGVIDGRFGQNVHNAISAFELAHGMPADGQLTPAVWNALVADGGPVLRGYVISADDVKGPFIKSLPADFEAQSKLPYLGFTSPRQAIAEKFHMGEDLLAALNPGVDFSKAGTPIVVAALGLSDLPTTVARVEVDKDREAVRAYDAQGRLIADYPSTVGSEERPSPSGTYKVARVDWNPTYRYDPSVLTYGHWNHAFSIKPGPNGPEGIVRMELSKPTFAVHGAPNPERIGKTASHGCVRLTNWDATQLARAVTPGSTVVTFVGSKQSTATPASGASNSDSQPASVVSDESPPSG